MPHTPAIVVLGVGLAVAVATDLRAHRIPNWLTAGIAAAGFGIAAGGGQLTLFQAALGMVVGLMLMLPGHVIGATGAGDVKLMAAIGAVVGTGAIVRVFLYSAVVGGALAVFIAARRGILAPTLVGAGHLVTAPATARQLIEAPARANRFAYGPAIAVGTCIALLVR